jgi:hypothetical protein
MTQKTTSEFSPSESRQRQRVVDTLTRLMVTDRTISDAEMRFLKDMFQRLDDGQLKQVLHSWFPDERQAQAVSPVPTDVWWCRNLLTAALDEPRHPAARPS